MGGHEISAYVTSLAHSRDNFWILAHMTPSCGRDGSIIGFHSNRRLPERTIIAKVEPLYASLVSEEKRHDDRVKGLAAWYRSLTDTLPCGGKSYDE